MTISAAGKTDGPGRRWKATATYQVNYLITFYHDCDEEEMNGPVCG